MRCPPYRRAAYVSVIAALEVVGHGREKCFLLSPANGDLNGGAARLRSCATSGRVEPSTNFTRPLVRLHAAIRANGFHDAREAGVSHPPCQLSELRHGLGLMLLLLHETK